MPSDDKIDHEAVVYGEAVAGFAKVVVFVCLPFKVLVTAIGAAWRRLRWGSRG